MIRLATSGDATQIAEIHVETWRAAYRNIVPDSFLATLSVEKRAEGWRRRIESNPRLVLVAESEGQIVGWIAVGPGRDEDSNAQGEVYAIYVQPNQWAAGIGRDLMIRGEEELSSLGGQRVVLWVFEKNDRARRFYEKLGYASDGRRKQISLDETELMEIRYEKKTV